MGQWEYSSIMLDLDTDGSEWSPLRSGKEVPISIVYESQYRRCEQEKKIFRPYRELNPKFSAIQPIDRHYTA
jgi:hypothetical protein